MRERTHRQAQLVKHFTKPIHLSFHLFSRLVPEPLLIGLLEPDRRSFLQRAHARVAYPCVRCSNILDQVGWSDQPTHAPSCSIKVLPRRANGEGERCDFGVERCHACKGDVVQTVVDFVGENENLMLNAKRSNLLQFGGGEDFSDGVVAKGKKLIYRAKSERRMLKYGVLMTWKAVSYSSLELEKVSYNHLRLGINGPFKLIKVNRPFTRGSGLGGAVFRRAQRHISNSAARHFDIAQVPGFGSADLTHGRKRAHPLVEEWLKDDDFVTRLDECHESAEHAFVSPSRNRDFGVRIDRPSKQR